MRREDQEVALRWAFREEHLSITRHARIEMGLRGINTDDVTTVGGGSEVIEEDRERPQGTTKVLLGHSKDGDAMHLVVNVEAYEQDFEEPVEVVTVYRPEPPKWRDERTRGGDER